MGVFIWLVVVQQLSLLVVHQPGVPKYNTWGGLSRRIEGFAPIRALGIAPAHAQQ